MLNQIEALWREHRGARYPDGYGGEEVAGVELVLLDADIAGCIEAFLASRAHPLIRSRT